MQPKRLKPKTGPEARLQKEIKAFLEARGWFVKSLHGGSYQAGFPDLYITHKNYGGKWVEIKLPNMEGSKWTKAQIEVFPKLADNGTPIWVMTGATEFEYRKLSGPENWLEYFLLKM